jgi:MoxR-like ATPase
MALPALQARAMMDGRDFVAPADVDALLEPIFSHRLELASDAAVASGARPIITSLAGPHLENLATYSMRRSA